MPYIFILGRPIPPRPEYPDEAAWNKAHETLRGFSDEYAARCEAESATVQQRMTDGQTRVAMLVYNTG